MLAAWITDPHLDYIEKKYFDSVINNIKENNAHILLISGDISNSTYLHQSLSMLDESLNIPIYFVLGNHDYYGNSFQEVDNRLTDFTRNSSCLNWLNKQKIVKLTPNTCLIGHDGWYDGGFGDYANTRMRLTDFNYISDLLGKNRWDRLKVFKERANKAVKHLNKYVPLAVKQGYTKIYFVTHVPPFKESSLYKGIQSDKYSIPFFASKLIGECLIKLMTKYPECSMTVLCGHTHDQCNVKILDNLWVKAGKAAYREIYFEVINI